MRLLVLWGLIFSQTLFAQKLTDQQIHTLESIYLQAKSLVSEIEESFGADEYFKEYEASYQRVLKSTIGSSSSVGVLFDELAKANVVLMSDDHSNIRSQRNIVHVLDGMGQSSKENIVFVVEWIDVAYQQHIDAFLKGDIDSAKLRELIDFDKYWGFNWEEHLKILEKVKEFGGEVLTVESRLEGKKKLKQRDDEIIERIFEHKTSKKNSRYLIAYGAYHTVGLGSAERLAGLTSDEEKNNWHLRRKLQEIGMDPDMTIRAQAGETYWQILKATKDLEKVQVLRLGKKTYYLSQGEVSKLLGTLQYYSGFADWMDEEVQYLFDDFGLENKPIQSTRQVLGIQGPNGECMDTLTRLLSK